MEDTTVKRSARNRRGLFDREFQITGTTHHRRRHKNSEISK